ncbi:FKBP-type peptidyl-prolyl cis-trans isomerase FklB [Algoriphagus iocasae]|uniref:Peptidyl-prolyl cis-trans isomerase n=1 Tax=Algoriphagus iocasae TaxID=1836499 RepID=A0A841MQX3_9BACT|nr:FKBP-type peptidyl-prolyl cis-trans isomerase [Algoriphagus iocasae]MBB6326576.1 FKBP-type peptidyl-prolyl cis-trans isomerase FklB [Algoriphagus iocasae]
MRIKLYSLVALAMGSISLFSCVDSEETTEAIFLADKEAIENYLDTASIVNVKEFSLPEDAYYQIWQFVSGSQDSVFVGDTVKVHYIGKFLSGTVFDTSIEQIAVDNGLYNPNYNYLPLKFVVGDGLVLTSFAFGISKMELGDKATIIIPSELGYGRQGYGPVPPNTPLVFEMELMEITPGPRNN